MKVGPLNKNLGSGKGRRSRLTILFGAVSVSMLVASSSLAGTASNSGSSSAASAAVFPARITLTEFAVSQAYSVKLIYKFPKPSNSFSYRLRMKRGSDWPVIKTHQQKGKLRGQKAMRMSKVFGHRWVKPGFYRLEIYCPSANKVINFKVLPFAGQLTKKRFTLAEANSIRFTYAFSKASKSFTYQLSVKKGSGWKRLNSYKKVQKKKRLYFKGVRRTTLKKIFGKKRFALGSYRIRFTCAYSIRSLKFSIVPPEGGDGPGGAAGGSGGGGTTTGADFQISGGVTGLQPGVPKPIRLTLTNPNDEQIYVTQLRVAISADSTPTGCPSATNIRITQSDTSDNWPIAVPGDGSTILANAPRAPQIELLDQPWNQDACKGASFTLTYSGSAHS